MEKVVVEELKDWKAIYRPKLTNASVQMPLMPPNAINLNLRITISSQYD